MEEVEATTHVSGDRAVLVLGLVPHRQELSDVQVGFVGKLLVGLGLWHLDHVVVQ